MPAVPAFVSALFPPTNTSAAPPEGAAPTRKGVESLASVRNAPRLRPMSGKRAHYDSRVVMAYGSDDVVLEAARDLFEKYAHRSVLIHHQKDAPPRVLAGDPACLGGSMKVVLVGHGERGYGGLGPVSANAVAAHITKLHDGVNRNMPARISKVSAIGCYTGNNSKGPGFAHQLKDALVGYGIRVRVKGCQSEVAVARDGHKVLIDDFGRIQVGQCHRIRIRRVPR